MRFADRTLTATKGYFDGTHRSCAPSQTIARITPLLPRMGITRIADITGLDRIGLPVCVAIRPNARTLSTSQGKGRTREAAHASAMMEAVESWHGERIAAPLRIDSWAAMAEAQDLPDPAAFGLRAAAHLDPTHPIPWVRGWDLLADDWAWLPHETVSTDFVESPDHPPLFLKSTNGLASGNNLAEAISHALYELVERDALTLADLPGAAPARRIDPASVPDAHFQGLAQRLAECGVLIFLRDITSDIGLPSFTVELIDDPRHGAWRKLPQVAGHGTHADWRVALSRAVHEAIQSRATIISGSRDDLFPRDYLDAVDLDTQLAMARAANRNLAPLAHGDAVARPRFEDDLADILRRLRAAGLRHVYAVDLAREEIGVPVVKVVAPGLEPPRSAQYRPGRRALAQISARAA